MQPFSSVYSVTFVPLGSWILILPCLLRAAIQGRRPMWHSVSASPRPSLNLDRRRWQIKGWLAALLLVCLIAVNHREVARTKQDSVYWGLRGLMEREMFAWDVLAQRANHIPRWLRSLSQINTLPQRLKSTVDAAMVTQTDTRSDLLARWSLACLRFGEDGNEAEWKAQAHSALKELSSDAGENLWLTCVRKAVESEMLTEEERKGLAEYLQSAQLTWWSVELARRHGLRSTLFSTELQKKRLRILEDSALHGLLMAGILRGSVPLFLMVFFGGFLCWCRGRPVVRASTSRLIKSWSPSVIIGIFTLTQLVVFAVSPVLSSILSALILGNELYPIRLWIGIVFGLAFLLAPPTILKLTLTRGKRTLQNALGFAWKDVWIKSAWEMGVAFAAMALVLAQMVSWLLPAPVANRGMVDFLSRSMNYLGESALPVHLLFACAIAPVVEEIVFRGILFSSMRYRWGTGSAMIASSAVFAVLHDYSWYGSAFTFVYGIMACCLYLRAGKLAPVMIFHGVVNLFQVGIIHGLTGG